ncbi:trehalose 6-phosphatase (EC 3.1.3.12) [Streptoalloteichus tenebrarius]|uniref:Trehalose 6-phosphatase n=1 Tax=Streptoalloteichus tenebrarius (strain ATCC 17920 / DSM 40477 / JCM 4838 / CBS 697.72 / NBRC 16177 / NCIMB 11028 / NRRL B-12390 / A12253. 1 / ISP 5477) TaxID=1933 RepID=A0ABT1HZ57_STRSD|nr:trehalose-phosphatase [Streptoalloteichus tenebrarius]MCP2260645.1 trehalose 6-phosphatase (EC 3.1.3.12) [Streptoalloteichus tenebrarius]BFF01529.1 trehalose-phosphatase [Streptoalloteichus tenebrarius]
MTAEALPAELRRAIVQLARTPRLLVACDYDGTLAPIVEDPERARPLPESVNALRSLAGLPATTAAVISGRALRDLATLSRLPAEVHLVGSHGSEFDVGFVHALDPAARDLHRRLHAELERIIAGAEGVSLEDKPASLAVHVRRAPADVAERVLDQVRRGPCAWDGVQVTEGKAVIELAVVQTDKGHALDVLRHQVGATAAIFLGDDVTDEKAFARLHGPDLGLKVGPGETLAGYRIDDTVDVACVLAFLLEERRTWLYGEQAPPIERLTMLANERSVALLTPDAKVTWMCHPEPDSAAVFADLLGGAGAGHFWVKPERNGLPLGQRYLPGTMTVETRWSRLLVTDYLDHYAAPHRTDLVRVISGSTSAVVEFAPRPEFGQVPVRLLAEPDGLRVVGTSEPMVLRAPGVEWQITSDGMHESARAVVRPTPDTPVVLELRCGSDDLGPSHVAEPERRRRSGAYWSDWLAGLRLPNVERDLVARSALTLRGLCHADTGAILAAATTSLPEEIGGVRNWDYRYCWLRDAALTAQTLVSLGSLGEAEAFLDWVHRVLATLPGPERLHPLYTIHGNNLGPEAVIDTLPGYAGSRPVRVGNLANQQVQLDVFGPVVELVVRLTEARGKLTDDDWGLVRAMAEAVARRWHEPDHGIWEERHAPRHHVYSKVMCWVTLDRAVRLGETYGRPVDPSWPELRDAIAADVLKNGWNDEVQSFTTAYDGTDLDAASLHVGLTRLIDPTDERFQATVTAIEAELRSGSTVYRYRRDDGLPGDEGGFHLCAAWMIEAYLLTGRRTEAEELFQQLVDAAGPTGLLPEEYDPIAERSLGNHPQAYSHLGLIRCAQLLEATAPEATA